jgi:hypothetical protein
VTRTSLPGSAEGTWQRRKVIPATGKSVQPPCKKINHPIEDASDAFADRLRQNSASSPNALGASNTGPEIPK